MMAHIGCDKHSIVRALPTTDAAQVSISQVHELLHDKESEVYDDQTYWSLRHRQAALAKRGALLDQTWRLVHQAADLPSELHQPDSLALPRPVRARFQPGQALVGLSQGALPRLRQEHRPTAYGPCAGEPVSARTTLGTAVGNASMKVAKTEEIARQPTKVRSLDGIPCASS